MKTDTQGATSAPPSSWVTRHAGLMPQPGIVLDLACGKGRHTRFLLAEGFKVVAVDRDLSGMEDLRGNTRVTLQQADLENGIWPFANQQFAGIVVTNYLYRPHFPLLCKALLPGGILIFETFAAGHERYGRPRNPAFLLQTGELQEAFATELEIQALEEAEDLLPQPAVRQRIVARKPCQAGISPPPANS